MRSLWTKPAHETGVCVTSPLKINLQKGVCTRQLHQKRKIQYMPHYHPEKCQHQWSFSTSWSPFDIFPLSHIGFGGSHNRKIIFLVNYNWFLFSFSQVSEIKKICEKDISYMKTRERNITGTKWFIVKVIILLEWRTSSLWINVYNNNVNYSLIYQQTLIKICYVPDTATW